TFVTTAPGEVINGSTSLVLNNPDHSKQGFVSAVSNPALVRLEAPNTYLLTFSWRILETIDTQFGVWIQNNGTTYDASPVPGSWQETTERPTSHSRFQPLGNGRLASESREAVGRSRSMTCGSQPVERGHGVATSKRDSFS